MQNELKQTKRNQQKKIFILALTFFIVFSFVFCKTAEASHKVLNNLIALKNGTGSFTYENPKYDSSDPNSHQYLQATTIDEFLANISPNKLQSMIAAQDLYELGKINQLLTPAQLQTMQDLLNYGENNQGNLSTITGKYGDYSSEPGVDPNTTDPGTYGSSAQRIAALTKPTSAPVPAPAPEPAPAPPSPNEDTNYGFFNTGDTLTEPNGDVYIRQDNGSWTDLTGQSITDAQATDLLGNGGAIYKPDGFNTDDTLTEPNGECLY